jgi:hypothetical protein
MLFNYLIYNSTVFYIFFTGTVIFIGYSLYNYAVTTVRPVLPQGVVILSYNLFQYEPLINIREFTLSQILDLYMDELCNNNLRMADLTNIINSFTEAQLWQSNINEMILLAIQNFHG